MKDLKALCRDNKLLLIFDEVQSGMGRTGSLFAYEQEAAPDIMTLAKALANGLPMGAMLATDEIASAFTPGSHASTFGGGPLVASAALAVLGIISEPAFLSRVVETGAYFISRLNGLKDRYPFIKSVRGRGLMVGVELAFAGAGIVEKCMQRGAIINCTRDVVLRFVPPLIAGVSEVDEMIGILDSVFKEEA